MAGKPRSLWQSLPEGRRGWLQGARGTVMLEALAAASSLDVPIETLRGRSVLLIVRDPLVAALAMIELDGFARRMVLCPPDLAAQYLPGVIACAATEVCVRGSQDPPAPAAPLLLQVTAQATLRAAAVDRAGCEPTEWVLLTSGTTGAPKLVVHDFGSLISAFSDDARESLPPIWTTFYDNRRYGGLQILLRGLLQGSVVLPDEAEPLEAFLTRAAETGVTHISGTPSHWRRALMSGIARTISPRYVRLSGEIADQGILNALRTAYPSAIIAHAFASTEAGVAFEVRDGIEGFPRSLLETAGQAVELAVRGGTLRVRSPGNARGYLRDGLEPLTQPDGFVDTGDRLELNNGRYRFMGREGGTINVGGLKVHPEEIEAVLNAHPAVRMSRVTARRSPITGAVVAAEVVLTQEAAGETPQAPAEALIPELTERCRRTLAAYKVPALIRIVPTLDVSASGKLLRPDA